MRNALVILVMLIIVSAPCRAQQQEISIFVKANAAYAQEDYDQAVSFYHQILDSGEESGPVFYNLANAYFKKGDLGHAVLNYERALQYIPRDVDLQANYRYALSLAERTDAQVSDNILKEIFKQHFQFYTVNETAWIVLFLFAVLAVVHLCGLYFSWRLNRKIAGIVLVMVMLIFYVAGFISKVEYLADRAIILKDTAARFEPREDATVHFSLFEGNSADMIKEENGWVKVKRSDDKTGWIKSAMIEKI